MSDIGGKGSEGAGRSTGICWVVTLPSGEMWEMELDRLCRSDSGVSRMQASAR